MKYSKYTEFICAAICIASLMTGYLASPAGISGATVPDAKKYGASGNKATVAGFYDSLSKSLSIPSTDIEKKAGISRSSGYLLTNERAAVITQAADVIKEGKDKFNLTRFKAASGKKRIIDINSAGNASQDAIRKVFVKGIMVGKSGGKCTQYRKFRPNSLLTANEANAIVKRAANVSARFKLSNDAQVIRTTNLPKYAKRYRYILANFPNSFYNQRQDWYGWKPKAKPGKDYVLNSKLHKYSQPSTETDSGKINMNTYLETYGAKMANVVKRNLQCRFSYNYKKSRNAWFKKLRKTYYMYGDAYGDKRTNTSIKTYMKKAKKNKVKIQYKQITVDTNSAYKCNGTWMFKCYVKFKATSRKWTKDKKGWLQNIIYANCGVYLKGLKKGKWWSGYLDIPMVETAYGQADGTETVDTFGAELVSPCYFGK